MFYGQHFHAGPGEWVTDPSPCNLHRLWDVDAPISWHDIDQPSGYVWTYLDWRVSAAQAAGCQVAYVIGITPERLRTSTVADGHNIPGGSSFPSDLNAFRLFVRALVARYPAEVMPILELPELVAPGFNRSPAYLALMVQIMREEAPDRLIPSPAFFSIDHAAAYFAEPQSKPCPAVNLHLYGQTENQLRDTLAAYDAVLADLGVTAPVWLSEFGWRKDQTNAADWPIHTMTIPQIAADVVGGTFALLKERGDLGGCWYSWEPKRPDILLSMADKPELIEAMTQAMTIGTTVGPSMPAPTPPTYPPRPAASATADAVNLWLRECEEISRRYGNELAAYGHSLTVIGQASYTTATEAATAAQVALAAANQALAAAARNGGELQALTLLAASYVDKGKTPAEAATLARAVFDAVKPRPVYTF